VGETEMLDDVLKVIKKIAFQMDNLERYAQISLGLSANQSAVISAIDRDFHYTHTSLAGKTKISKSTLSGTLCIMEKKGLIERVRSKDDGRKSYVNLTSQGRALRFALMSNGAKSPLGNTDMTELEKKLLYILLKKLSNQLGDTT
jgi:DNA-binding MarR family transcriptional regulator